MQNRYSDSAILTAIAAADEQNAPTLTCGKSAYLSLTPRDRAAVNRGIRVLNVLMPKVGPIVGLEILTAIAMKQAQIEDADNGND